MGSLEEEATAILAKQRLEAQKKEQRRLREIERWRKFANNPLEAANYTRVVNSTEQEWIADFVKVMRQYKVPSLPCVVTNPGKIQKRWLLYDIVPIQLFPAGFSGWPISGIYSSSIGIAPGYVVTDQITLVSAASLDTSKFPLTNLYVPDEEMRKPHNEERLCNPICRRQYQAVMEDIDTAREISWTLHPSLAGAQSVLLLNRLKFHQKDEARVTGDEPTPAEPSEKLDRCIRKFIVS